MKNLTPSQIAILADIVQVAIINYPVDNITDSDKHSIHMEEWECFVKGAVNAHPQLPGYEELQNKHQSIYEFLVGYYST
jgi:hypothetical protein